MQGLYHGAGMGAASRSGNHLVNKKKDQHTIWTPV